MACPIYFQWRLQVGLHPAPFHILIKHTHGLSWECAPSLTHMHTNQMNWPFIFKYHIVIYKNELEREGEHGWWHEYILILLYHIYKHTRIGPAFFCLIILIIIMSWEKNWMNEWWFNSLNKHSQLNLCKALSCQFYNNNNNKKEKYEATPPFNSSLPLILLMGVSWVVVFYLFQLQFWHTFIGFNEKERARKNVYLTMQDKA